MNSSIDAVLRHLSNCVTKYFIFSLTQIWVQHQFERLPWRSVFKDVSTPVLAGDTAERKTPPYSSAHVHLDILLNLTAKVSSHRTASLSPRKSLKWFVGCENKKQLSTRNKQSQGLLLGNRCRIWTKRSDGFMYCCSSKCSAHFLSLFTHYLIKLSCNCSCLCV